jgi:hypothetical protein
MQGMQIAYLASRGQAFESCSDLGSILPIDSTQPQAVAFASLYKFEKLGEANSDKCLFGSLCIFGPFFRMLSTTFSAILAGRGGRKSLARTTLVIRISPWLRAYAGTVEQLRHPLSSTELLQRNSTLQRVIFTRDGAATHAGALESIAHEWRVPRYGIPQRAIPHGAPTLSRRLAKFADSTCNCIVQGLPH